MLILGIWWIGLDFLINIPLQSFSHFAFTFYILSNCKVECSITHWYINCAVVFFFYIWISCTMKEEVNKSVQYHQCYWLKYFFNNIFFFFNFNTTGIITRFFLLLVPCCKNSTLNWVLKTNHLFQKFLKLKFYCLKNISK